MQAFVGAAVDGLSHFCPFQIHRVAFKYMEIAQLAFWLQDFVSEFIEIDGYLFLDRSGKGLDTLKGEIAKYASAKAAQSWINIFLVDDFLSDATGDQWEFNDSGIDALLSVYERVWTRQIQLLYPGATFRIERLADEAAGDLGLRLINR